MLAESKYVKQAAKITTSHKMKGLSSFESVIIQMHRPSTESGLEL